MGDIHFKCNLTMVLMTCKGDIHFKCKLVLIDLDFLRHSFQVYLRFLFFAL
ncbi:unknown [Methanothermobacter thermautotrophicus str. Delta H]|uniref:Uncharacterized protein n=1 Tax=Methanothermobacter thermautotrophicus (strain ATCC 29096 / DSM 1053 / JCM 10044 / NBRC 100330 / Delta H) TaxID=187420 RepID=O27462_METTH|nr:unknown [Methanothermobacter thermautotrophicus str. Delta H]